MELKTRNVNTAFRQLVGIFCPELRTPPARPYPGLGIVRRPSRNGYVLMIDEPVTITYERPTERVLFNAARDANPFLHLYEALWMLAGRNDVAPLTYYTKRMTEFSDDGETLNGAYGYRWREQDFTIQTKMPPTTEYPHGYQESEAKTVDQLDLLVQHLKADLTSRRAVLQMWNVEDDLLKVGSSKDVCCNLSVMFSIRKVTEVEVDVEPDQEVINIDPLGQSVLDMTVTNRSNDLVWGLLGTNYVTFSILQEYMAARLGIKVGLYRHFTNNLHAYVRREDWKPEKWLESYRRGDYPTRVQYQDGPYSPEDKIMPHHRIPLVRDPEAFERELPAFVKYGWPGGADCGGRPRMTEPFLDEVALPMVLAHQFYKSREQHKGWENTVRFHLDRIESDDWRIAARSWIYRRIERGVKK